MKTYVQLGRLGDVMNILPLLQADFQKTGEKPQLMIAAEYAPLLDGVSYVEPILHNGPHYELEQAITMAKIRSKEVVVTQVNGPAPIIREQVYLPTGSPNARATSFQKESWRVAGRLTQWDDLLPLTFDRRDKARETALLKKHDLGKRGQKPLLLLSLKSNSSPFPYEDLLRELVTLKFADTHRVLELPQAERIYDLLAIYERAAALIVVDSAPLHLAWAERKLPVFALVQDKPLLWHGSSWRPNHVWYCRYRNWPVRAMEMIHAIASLQTRMSGAPYLNVWSAYEDRAYYEPRPERLPVTIGACGRDSGNVLKDDERHPYLRDVIRMAIQRAPADSMPINLTRPFVTIRHQRTDPRPPYYAYRMQWGGDRFGETYSPITDLFCATKKWWKDVVPEIPDLVLNGDYTWSECLRVLFQQRGARDETGVCYFGKEPTHA
jgi:hypothetical protein